jgi:hypothetical protein
LLDQPIVVAQRFVDAGMRPDTLVCEQEDERENQR